MSLWSDFSPGPLNPGEHTHNYHTLPREEDRGEGEREGGVGWRWWCRWIAFWNSFYEEKKEMDLWQLVNVRCFQFILASLRGEFILVPNDFIKAKVLLPSRPGPGTARPCDTLDTMRITWHFSTQIPSSYTLLFSLYSLWDVVTPLRSLKLVISNIQSIFEDFIFKSIEFMLCYYVIIYLQFGNIVMLTVCVSP